MTIAGTRQSLPTIHAHIDAVRLSDLFFNHEHPEYDNECRGQATFMDEEARGAAELERSRALLKDAVDFVKLLTGTHDVTLASALVDDFFERL